MDSNRFLASLIAASLIATASALAQTTPPPAPPPEGQDVQPKFLWGLLLRIAAPMIFEAFDTWAQKRVMLAQQQASAQPGGSAPSSGGLTDIAVAYAQYRQQQYGRQSYYGGSQPPPGQPMGPGMSPGYPQQQPGSPPPSYPSQPQSYPQQQPGYPPPSYPSQPPSYPSQPQSYPSQPQSYPQQQPGYPPSSYPSQPQSYPQQQAGSYPPAQYPSAPTGYQQQPGGSPPQLPSPGDPARTYPFGARSIILVGQQPTEPLKTANNQNNYQMARLSLVSVDADGKQVGLRSIRDGFRTGERFKLKMLSTFDALIVIENINPRGEQKQIYPGQLGKAVQVPAGREVLVPLEPSQSFQFAEDSGDEQLLITLRDPRAFGAQASTRPVYREDRPEFSTFGQEVAPDLFPVIGQAITLRHTR